MGRDWKKIVKDSSTSVVYDFGEMSDNRQLVQSALLI
jgi:hypothetical protein